ncbi:hypothetical protein F7725_011525 [Dissostichus mawsoni]|uniref:rhomboid protease n=1 Tax=Dissostichus mawsoni TaxID=36200 RepID=A0A7J5Z942_DISMA|nr:hypothetical protein F7725_011525 [Dissostichus mawsoni]
MAWRGCVLKWVKTELIRSTNTLYEAPDIPHYQQRYGFRQEAKRPDTKKGNVSKKLKFLPRRLGLNLSHLLPKSPGRCSFGAAAILQYETLKSRVRTAQDEEKSEKFSQDMTYWHDWWNKLSGFQRQLILLVSMVDDFWSSLSEGQKTVTGIIALNAVVLCCWRIPVMQRSMVKYFTSTPAASEYACYTHTETRCLPMVLSTFSHYSIFHMAANMYVLWTFSSEIVSILGREQFLAFYLSAGVISNMVSYTCKTATRSLHPSLGASGAVMAVLAAVCANVPEAKLGIILLPMVTFTAGNALKALIAMDTAGLVLGWRMFDHAAHLGGALFGVWYVAYGHKLIWRKREPLVKLWHEARSPGAGGSRSGGGPGVSAGKSKLGDHQVGEAEGHEAIDLRQPVETEGSLQKVFRAMPHALVPAARVLFQVSFDKDPGGFVNAACGRYSKVHGNVVTVLCFIYQRMHCWRLVLEELQVATVEEGSTN